MPPAHALPQTSAENIGATASASPAASERIHALDALRAVAMFLGIVLHAAIVFTVTAPMPGGASDVSRSIFFDVMILLIHGFRMHLFFFLAGFFGRLLHQRLGTKGFAKQRLKRIGLPFALGMITIMPMVLFIAMWGFAREGEPIPEFPGRPSGVPTMHLWFLLYLLYLYAGAIVIVTFANRIPSKPARTLNGIFRAVINHPLRAIAFASISAIFLWNGPWWGEPRLGIFGLLPEPSTLAYYGTFFAVGWWLHAHSHVLQSFKKWIVPNLLIAAAAISLEGTLGHLHLRPIANLFVLKSATLFCSALYAWTMIFAAIGCFLRWLPKPGAWARYLADASYWCYLAHLPMVMFLQILVAKWQAPALIKFNLILFVTMALLLLIYEYRVRYTWIGSLLNGPRKRNSVAA